MNWMACIIAYMQRLAPGLGVERPEGTNLSTTFRRNMQQDIVRGKDIDRWKALATP